MGQMQRRRREEGGALEDESKLVPEPSRLESLLISNQVNTYCDQINKFAGQSFGKLFLMQRLHDE